MSKTVDQLIEETYLANTKHRVNAQFAEAEIAITSTFNGDEQAALTGSLELIKARLTNVLYEKGIEGHKAAVVSRIAGGKY